MGRDVEVVPFARSVRSARRGAQVGAVLGLIAGFVLLGVDWRNVSLRLAAGSLLMCVAGGAALGALIPARLLFSERPESKPKFLLLLVLIALVGFGGLVVGATVAGITGDRTAP